MKLDFLRVTRLKIAIFVILLFVISYFQMFWNCFGGAGFCGGLFEYVMSWILSFSLILSNLVEEAIPGRTLLDLILVTILLTLQIIYTYILSCLISFAYNRYKGRKNETADYSKFQDL